MLYQINVASQHYIFEDLKTLMAKASPERSGDQLAGIAAHDATAGCCTNVSGRSTITAVFE